MPRYTTLTLQLTDEESIEAQKLINQDNHNNYTSLSIEDSSGFTFSPQHMELKITCTSEFAMEILSLWVKPLFPVKKYLFLKTGASVPIGIFQSIQEAEKLIDFNLLSELLYKWVALDTYTNFSMTHREHKGQDTEFSDEVHKLFKTSDGWKPVAVTKFWE